MEYNDPLLRPTKVIPPAGGAQTVMEYTDTPLQMAVKTKTQIDANNWAESTVYADGLGRTVKTEKKDDAGNIFTETEYDTMGRVKRATNPFRNGETKLWTENTYDDLSRVIKVKTPDNAEVTTAYGLSTSAILGTIVTATDQAGKQRRSLTNALGQLVRVDEPDDAGNLGTVDAPTQATSYSYDTLNNLTTVNQGVQTRTFAYDSLSRLKQATNPESGTIAYAYDAGGNLTQKTDARNVVTTYLYDNLNRVTNRSYSDGTPNVSYTYDDSAIQYAKGKLTKVSSSVSETKYNSFDNLGRVLTSQQITDGNTYNFGYAYNLAGMLTEETYPSGRVVTNQFEGDGDLAQVGGAFQGNTKTYVSNFTYTSAGAVASLQLGNGRWENTQFNSRLQPVQIGLGSSANAQDLWKVNYDYGTTDNNGNVKAQTITVPNQFVANQVYTYDSLNRLKTANETIGGSQTWKQTFTFDRYGNRKFDPTQTTTLGNCPTNICNPDISATNNRVTTHQFDNAGNTTIDAEDRSFFYDAENKQKEVRDASNNIIGQYLYDGDGKRVKKISANDTTIFVYDAGGKLASEYTVSASQRQAPTTSYLTNDTLGSPRVTTDQAGNVVSRRDFRPYGEEINRPNQGTDSIRQKFTGYERDNETDLDFAQARMYSSKIGRFNTVDPLMASADIINPQTFNRYVYVGNNPINITDPTGMDWGVKDGNLKWFDGSPIDGYKPYNALVGKVGNQLVVLSATAGTWTPATNPAEALKIIAGAVGVGAAAFGASALALGVPVALATAYIAAVTYSPGQVDATMDDCFSCGFMIQRHVNRMNAMMSEEADKLGKEVNKTSHIKGETSPADPNSGTPDPNANKPSQGSNQPQNVYNSIKDSPNYPNGFKAVQNGSVNNKIKNADLLSELRKIAPGEWRKVYKDGNVNGNRVSIHYFQHKDSGKVFSVQVKQGWSNSR